MQSSGAVEFVKRSTFFKFCWEYHGHDRPLTLVRDLHSPAQVHFAFRESANHQTAIDKLYHPYMRSRKIADVDTGLIPTIFIRRGQMEMISRQMRPPP